MIQHILYIIIFLLQINCNNKPKNISTNNYQNQLLILNKFDTTKIINNENKIYFDSVVLISFLNRYQLFKTYYKDIYNFYYKREFTLVWFDNNGLTNSANTLLYNINDIPFEGLSNFSEYKLKSDFYIHSTISNKNNWPLLDIFLTAQYLSYLPDAR
jgi:hypothetical protein